MNSLRGKRWNAIALGGKRCELRDYENWAAGLLWKDSDAVQRTVRQRKGQCRDETIQGSCTE